MCDIEALRLFVNDRLTAVAEDILAVFVSTIVQYQQQIDLQHRHGVTSELADILHPPVSEEEGSAEHQQMSSSPIQEEIKEEHEEIFQIPQGSHVSTMTLRSVKSEHNENGETEPLASTSTEHMKIRAGVVEYGGTSQPTGDVKLLSSESDSDESEDSESPASSRPSSPFQIKTPPPSGQSALVLRAPAIVSPLQPLLVLGRCLKNQCGQCGRIFTSPAALESHVSGHTNLSPFTCRHCGKVFNDNRGLNRHKAHHDGRAHKCEQCGKGFVYKFSLTRHVERVHSGRLKPFVCPYCNKDFATKQEVQSHTRVHSGETPYHCHLCEAKFKRKMDLNKHLRWHNGEKRYWCPYCEKGFLDSNNFKIHTYTHTGEKPRACPHCPKKFTQTAHLKKHLRTIHKQE